MNAAIFPQRCAKRAAQSSKYSLLELLGVLVAQLFTRAHKA